MSFFDDLKKKIDNVANSSFGRKSESFVFDDIPTTIDAFKALPQADLKNPAAVVALTVIALNVYPADKDAAVEMLNYLRGPAPLSNIDKQFIRDRFSDNKLYVPRSYFNGATPDNDYSPVPPFTIEVNATPHTCDNEKDGRLTYYVRSGGADSPRPVTVRNKPSTNEWFVTEYSSLLLDIRVPKSSDPWS